MKCLVCKDNYPAHELNEVCIPCLQEYNVDRREVKQLRELRTKLLIEKNGNEAELKEKLQTSKAMIIQLKAELKQITRDRDNKE